jgi:hypothetical protein
LHQLVTTTVACHERAFTVGAGCAREPAHLIEPAAATLGLAVATVAAIAVVVLAGCGSSKPS